ncbi:ankyrin repeats (many copies) domain-containing protein [Ditylenchus destructor]|nr:ankyrin repeats (many copies) domain-containing protein [Ditylenchus destructor]
MHFSYFMIIFIAVGIVSVVRASPHQEAVDGKGRTALHIAAANNAIDVAYTLKENGANVDAKDKDGRTPLHLVATMERTFVERAYDITGHLLRGGANKDATDNNQQTPLHLAAIHNADNVAYKLIRPVQNWNLWIRTVGPHFTWP